MTSIFFLYLVFPAHINHITELSLSLHPSDAELDEGLAERLRILADARALKNLATAFLHPENPVVTTDGDACGRNYFSRPSAPLQMEDEDADEIAEILEDALKLKKAARAYLHPEDPVVTEDAAVFGRNYFNRASAPEVESLEEANELTCVLADAMALKKAAVDYMHPEIGVKSADGACFGRNYFNRASAPESEDDEFADERAKILADALTLNKSAIDYLHPDRLESRRLTEPALVITTSTVLLLPRLKMWRRPMNVPRSWRMLWLSRSLQSTTCTLRLE